MYGCNPEKDNAEAKKQNDDLELATTYKGSVLVEFSVKKEEHPVLKIHKYKEDDGFKARQLCMKD